MKDYTGENFNNVTIIKHLTTKGEVEYRCICGYTKTGNIYDIKRGKIKGCGKGKCRIRPNQKDIILKLMEEGKMNRGGDHHPKKFREFKYLMKCMKNSNRKCCEVTLEDLNDIWNEQSGKCIYSGVDLQLPTHTNSLKDVDPWFVASIDRIDSTKPYIKGNIQFISKTLNYAKPKMPHKKMLEFLCFLKNSSI